ncbi:MAG: hypothetical protein ABI706_06655 [Ilumatobacteraceae bacterium]
MNRPSPAVVFVIIVAAAVPFLDLGDGAPGAATSAVGAVTTSISVGSVASSLPTASTVAPAIVTIVGTINRLLASGEVVMNDGQTDYTVGMSATTKIRNLRGDEVTHDFIQLGAQIQVSGTLTGSRILDPTILIPTVLDKP